MNSREIVTATLEYAHPERVAHSYPKSDFASCRYTSATHATAWSQLDQTRWERTDEWGNRWARVDQTSKGEVVKGVLDSIEDIAGYEFPDFSRADDYRTAADKRAQLPETYVLGSVPGLPFNIARKLFKLEEYLCCLLTDREAIGGLHDRIENLVADMIVNYAAAGVDGIMFCEDWGTQDRTLVSPALWREEFFPRFRRLCGLAHENGIRVLMHSCGAIGAIVPGLIEAGIDCLQFDQPALHGIDDLAEHQGRGRITFWCPVDIQKTLQTRDESTIRAEARKMLDTLWRGRGGFIAGYYNDNASIGLEPRWQQIACEEFTARGRADNYSPEPRRACAAPGKD
jgi:hypothetical protein